MKKVIQNSIVPAAWLLYIMIVFEIIFMIMPFFALSFYSFYGPSLNFLHQWSFTSWMTGFFLPHFSESSSWLINNLKVVGFWFFFLGLIFFLVGAGQIYYAQFTKKGAVTSGLYKYLKNPQYTAFTIMGLGVMLVWPRFTVLLMFLTMVFFYYFLAKKEESDCLRKFGPSFQEYVSRTSMFLPGDKYILKLLDLVPPGGSKRSFAIAGAYLGFLILFTGLALGIRSASISTLSTYSTSNSITVATARMNQLALNKVLKIALEDDAVRKGLEKRGEAKFLNYVVPNDWFLADLPLEPYQEGTSGHLQPMDYDRNKYNVLFTLARHSGSSDLSGVQILSKTFGRVPILVAKVDLEKEAVYEINLPPDHVVWGDIPTPLF